VFEDLVMALYLPILTAVLGGGHRGTVSKGRGRDPVGLLRRLLALALLEADSGPR
jgi:hypothetical protein